MAKAKVKINFIKLAVPQKIQYAKDRVIDITGNGNFTIPEPPLADITSAANDLETKYNLAQGGGPAQTTAQNESEKVLDERMRKLAAYVSRIADGNVVIITSAGFTPTQTEPSPLGLPGKAENLVLKHGEQSGTILTECDKVNGAKGYVTIITVSAAPPLAIVNGAVVIQSTAVVPAGLFILVHTSTNRKAIYSGLVSGTRYYIRKYAFNAAGKGADSDVINIVAP